ncbi:hypothetical protein EBU58_10720 [bacterium]|nr:hypothetical protein [bacterium]
MDAPERITSSANPRVKAAARLRDAAERRTRGLTLIDGRREVERAAAAGVRFAEVYVDEAAPPPDALLDRLMAAGGQPVWLAPAAFSKVAYGSRNEGRMRCASRQADTEPTQITVVLSNLFETSHRVKDADVSELQTLQTLQCVDNHAVQFLG